MLSNDPRARRVHRTITSILGGSIACLLALSLIGCADGGTTTDDPVEQKAPSEEAMRAEADRLAQDLLIIDTHVDVPYRLFEGMEDISVATEKGDFDYPRAKAGGLNAPFMSIYVPADLQGTPGASKAHAEALIDMVEGFERDWPETFAVASSSSDLEEQFARGVISLPLGMENGSPMEDDLANVQYFFDRGIRYVTLTHSKNNQICDSSYEPAENRTWDGLSPFGEDVVREMNRLGIMVDISHVSDAAFYDVIGLTTAPVIASHSSVRHFTPDFERNMDDPMIKALADNGGVIQINFGSSFISQAANQTSSARWAAIAAYAEEHGLDRESEEMQAFVTQYGEEHPTVFADITDVVDHIDHVVQLVGVDHVGLGSDFDGVGDSLPTGLKDVSAYPNLIYHLLARGYSEEDVAKILGGNLMRVWRRVEEVAQEMQAVAATT